MSRPLQLLLHPVFWVGAEWRRLARPVAGELPVMNGLRSLSVLMILFFHSVFAVLYLFKSQPLHIQAFIDRLPPLFAGVFGFEKAVDLFFLLSAFLLTRSLHAEYQAQGRINLKRFYIHRLARIYPVFVFALLLYLPSQWSALEDKVWYSLAFIDNFIPTRLLPVSWSLSVEVQFYVLLPFIVLWVERCAKWRWVILLGLLVASVAIRFAVLNANPLLYHLPVLGLLEGDNGRTYMTSLYYPTYARFGPLILGVWWAYLAASTQFHQGLSRLPSVGRQVMFVLCLLLAYLALQFPFYQTWALGLLTPQGMMVGLTLDRVFFSGAIWGALLLLAAPTGSFMHGIERFMSWSIWRVGAQLSFPIFLFHFVFVIPAYALVLMTTDLASVHFVSWWQVLLAFIFLSIMTGLFSLPVHRYIEERGILWGRRVA